MNMAGFAHGDMGKWAARTMASAIRRAVHAEAEVERLKRGDFTPEEFQSLCHNRDEKPGCTKLEFGQGCHQYQTSLFGSPCDSEELAARDAEIVPASGHSERVLFRAGPDLGRVAGWHIGCYCLNPQRWVSGGWGFYNVIEWLPLPPAPSGER